MRELGRTPSLRRSWTEIVAGRDGCGVIRLRRAGGIPVLRNSLDGSMENKWREENLKEGVGVGI
jgi:hypothetical protein